MKLDVPGLVLVFCRIWRFRVSEDPPCYFLGGGVELYSKGGWPLGRLGLALFHGLIVATGNGDLHGREDAEGEE